MSTEHKADDRKQWQCQRYLARGQQLKKGELIAGVWMLVVLRLQEAHRRTVQLSHCRSRFALTFSTDGLCYDIDILSCAALYQ